MNQQPPSMFRLPTWLEGMVAPTMMLWLYVVAMGVAVAMQPNGRLPGRADYLSRAALAYVFSWWVIADARKRDRPLCYDYGSFVFFAWPIFLPVYLFQTRGKRAFITFVLFGGLWLIAMFIVSIGILIREFLFAPQ